jgi:hypothetical protein
MVKSNMRRKAMVAGRKKYKGRLALNKILAMRPESKTIFSDHRPKVGPSLVAPSLTARERLKKILRSTDAIVNKKLTFGN